MSAQHQLPCTLRCCVVALPERRFHPLACLAGFCCWNLPSVCGWHDRRLLIPIGPRRAAMRWTEPGAAKQLVFQCRGEEEVESYRHLLAYVHSFGKELPQGER